MIPALMLIVGVAKLEVCVLPIGALRIYATAVKASDGRDFGNAGT